ncbi:MAG TPA: cytochrome C [Rhodanobacteraceae bacterium]|nr:cytochrome C [Rhodanobacteraceae bacterium]
METSHVVCCERPRAARIVALVGVLLALSIVVPAARAVPAFARQMHQPCTACHIGGFGPQLTPFGRQFKRLAYALHVGTDTKVPLSMMLVETFTKTLKAQTEPPADGFGTNDNTEMQQASVFLAGRLANNLGVLAQATYSQNGHVLGWDNIDLRYGRNFTLAGKPAIWGLSLNNNPSVSDVFNTAPAWQFPYLAPDLAPGAPAAPILMGGFGQQVVGLTYYMQIDNRLDLEAGGYRSLSPAFLRRVNADFDGRIAGTAPYARAAYTWNLPSGNVELGAFGFHAARGLAGTDALGDAVALPGPTDKFTDFGIDASWQLLNGSQHIVTFNGLYLAERQHLDATFAAGGSSNRRDTLQALNINASYWYRNTWGATLGGFVNNGSSDLLLYGNEGSPNTQGGIVELNWNPFGHAGSWGQPYANVRVGLQYTWYTRFSGLVSNVDGAGRHASDNDTLYLYTWLAF